MKINYNTIGLNKYLSTKLEIKNYKYEYCEFFNDKVITKRYIQFNPKLINCEIKLTYKKLKLKKRLMEES